MCSKFDAPQQYGKFQLIQTHQGEFGSGFGTISVLPRWNFEGIAGAGRTSVLG
jgi:hypothetical protein